MPDVNNEAAHLTGERINFSFGKNWQNFLRTLTPEKLTWAEESLKESFQGADFHNRGFLDLGCGSGLFSLAARRLGAKVTSVDVDSYSVNCARRLRGDDAEWQVMEASILAAPSLPPADLVYSWGVLHHTGAMWTAVEQALKYVRPGGLACIALYNEPRNARAHLFTKRLYNRAPFGLRVLMKFAYGLMSLVASTVRGKNPIAYVRHYGEQSRGMSFWRDVEDWLGGLPIEYTDAREFITRLPVGFELVNTIERGPGACSEYLVSRNE